MNSDWWAGIDWATKPSGTEFVVIVNLGLEEIAEERDEARKWARRYKKLYEQAICEHGTHSLVWVEDETSWWHECANCGKRL